MSTQDMGVLIDKVYEGLVGTERDTVRLVPRVAPHLNDIIAHTRTLAAPGAAATAQRRGSASGTTP